MKETPRWVDVLLIPLINLALALIVAGLVVVFVGENPFRAVAILIDGALGSTYGWGFTLYYTTNFVFTGLAVAVAFHARMFNIGGEGQAGLAGVGVALVCLYVDWIHWTLALPFAMIGAMLFGAAWAAIPAWLQVKRGSHIVITTIMFNMIAFALLNYLLVGPLQAPDSVGATETAHFVAGSALPTFHDMAGLFGIKFSKSAPANISFFLAILACFAVWIMIWKMKIGYEIRAFGHSDKAAVYAGISPFKVTMVAMLVSGALAGLMAINTVMGEAERLVLNAVEGAGFVGIAVALMGRSHPVGVFLAAFLFGILYQGGAELAFEMPSITREMIVVIQALVILFTGSLDNMVRLPLENLFHRLHEKGDA